MQAKLAIRLALVASGVFLVSGCGLVERASQSRSVHIPQTPGESQGATDFCWSYAIASYLESERLVAKPSEPPIKLAEEYVGFYRIVEQLEVFVASHAPGKFDIELVETDSYQGAIDLFGRVGVVPESEFSHPALAMAQAAEDYFVPRLADEEQFAAFKDDPDRLRRQLAEALGIAPPPAPKSPMTTRPETPLAFLAANFDFRPEDFVRFGGGDAEARVTMLRAIRASLLKGHSVLGAIPGHALLLVDFVTEGGRAGELSPAQLAEVAEQPITHFVAKNSLASASLNQIGEPIEGGRYSLIKVEDVFQAYIRADYAQSTSSSSP